MKLLVEMKMRHTIKYLLILTLPVVVFTFLFLELFFRFIVPACEAPFCYYDTRAQVLRFEQNPSDGIHSIGPFAQQRSKWHINNTGWNSKIDYQANHEKPLFAIIGDSYIEALNVDVDRSITANLRRKLNRTFEVYSFAISGASLADYLHMSRYVRKTFKPDVLVINVFYNDFDESLCIVKSQGGRLCIKVTDTMIREEQPRPYPPSQIRRLLAQSALVRYLYVNLKIGNLNWFHYLGRGYSENVDVVLASQVMPEIEKAVEYIVERLVTENAEANIMFVIDAPRRDIYLDTPEKSEVIWMKQLLQRVCAKHSVQCLDLTVPFTAHYKEFGKRFESRWDWHWNELGHEIAAEAIYQRMNQLGWLQ